MIKNANAKRVVIYARVSTQDQDVENQLAQLKQYAASQCWSVVDTVVDVASGGKGRDGRRGLDRVFQMAHQRKFELLLFWALDRLSREGSRKTIAYLSQLEASGVGFHSYTESYLSSLGIFGDAIISLLSALARQERVRISERTRAGLQRAVAAGKKLGRRPTRPHLIERAHELREQGMSCAEIGKELGLSRSRAHQLVRAGVPKPLAAEAG